MSTKTTRFLVSTRFGGCFSLCVQHEISQRLAREEASLHSAHKKRPLTRAF